MPGRSGLVSVVAIALTLAGFAVGQGSERPASSAVGRPVPEFPSLAAEDWAGAPVSLASLKGRVVVLNVWTFGCVNCQRTLPWLRDLAQKSAGRDVTIVGIHTPEFDRERAREAVVRAIEREKLTWPSYIDNGQRMWTALDNHWWPSTWLVDRKGIVRFFQVGEIHAGDRAAAAFTAELERLLGEGS